MERDRQKELRKLPSVDRILNEADIQRLVQLHGHELTVAAVQAVLSQARESIIAGEACPPVTKLTAATAPELTKLLRPSLQSVINATGVIIHTNLGRAPLSAAAQEAMREASGYCNLEYEMATGQRGSRYAHAEDLLCRLTGAEAGLVVNNDAGAVLLILSALARGREVVISRGQLVEIGGGFRIPEVMAQSGAHLVEAGTTNRTYLEDYAAAITENTAMLLHVHSSNFCLIGFVHHTSLQEMVSLARERGLFVVDDLGSGALLDTASFGLSHEPTVQESLATGVDLVCFSGDKLLGGPQAGVILGKKEHVDALKRHPLTRALRVSKTILSGLQATLLHYVKGRAPTEIPVWQMIAMETGQIDGRAQDLAEWLQQRVAAPAASASNQNAQIEVIDGWSTVGGGSLPGETLPTRLIAIRVAAPQELAERLRLGTPVVVTRIENDAVLLDLRTVLPREEPMLRQALTAAL